MKVAALPPISMELISLRRFPSSFGEDPVITPMLERPENSGPEYLAGVGVALALDPGLPELLEHAPNPAMLLMIVSPENDMISALTESLKGTRGAPLEASKDRVPSRPVQRLKEAREKTRVTIRLFAVSLRYVPEVGAALWPLKVYVKADAFVRFVAAPPKLGKALAPTSNRRKTAKSEPGGFAIITASTKGTAATAFDVKLVISILSGD